MMAAAVTANEGSISIKRPFESRLVFAVFPPFLSCPFDGETVGGYAGIKCVFGFDFIFRPIYGMFVWHD